VIFRTQVDCSNEDAVANLLNDPNGLVKALNSILDGLVK